MAELVLTDVGNDVLDQLQLRATRHGRTPADEAKAILLEALHGRGAELWEPVDAIYHRLAASGRTFSDSAHQIEVLLRLANGLERLRRHWIDNNI